MTATLQMLLDEGVGLYYRCRCGHSDVLCAKTMATVWGPDVTIPEAGGQILCPKCGHDAVEVQPDWPSKGPGNIVNPVP